MHTQKLSRERGSISTACRGASSHLLPPMSHPAPSSPLPITPYAHAHAQHLLTPLSFHDTDITHTHMLVRHRVMLEDAVGVNGCSAAAECVQIAGKMEKVRHVHEHGACMHAALDPRHPHPAPLVSTLPHAHTCHMRCMHVPDMTCMLPSSLSLPSPPPPHRQHGIVSHCDVSMTILSPDRIGCICE